MNGEYERKMKKKKQEKILIFVVEQYTIKMIIILYSLLPNSSESQKIYMYIYIYMRNDQKVLELNH